MDICCTFAIAAVASAAVVVAVVVVAASVVAVIFVVIIVVVVAGVVHVVFVFGVVFVYTPKAWFPLNVSVLATDRSCLLARTSLRWAGFHRQASQGLLRGLLHQRYVNCAAHSVFNHK